MRDRSKLRSQNTVLLLFLICYYCALYDIRTQKLIEGDLPIRADAMVREWMSMYKDELLEMWNTQDFRHLPSLK